MMFGPRVVSKVSDDVEEQQMEEEEDNLSAVCLLCAQKTQAKCTSSCACVCVCGELHELMQQHERGGATSNGNIKSDVASQTQLVVECSN